jgi:hypothetical protein
MTAALALGVMLSAEVANADPFSLSGTLSTRGIFTCAGFGGLACTGSGTDTLVLGSGTNVATLTFEGIERDITVTNRAQLVTLGTFVVTGPEDFTFPTRVNDNLAIIRFDLTMDQTLQEFDSNTRRLSFGPGGGHVVKFLAGSTRSSFPLSGGFGPGFNYSRVVYSFNATGFTIRGNGATDFTADVGVVPEPGTIALVASGLAGAFIRRRRKGATDVEAG